MTSDGHLTAAAGGPRAGIRRTVRRPTGPIRSWYKTICVFAWRLKQIVSRNLPRVFKDKGQDDGLLSLFVRFLLNSLNTSRPTIWNHVCHFACPFALLTLLTNFIVCSQFDSSLTSLRLILRRLNSFKRQKVEQVVINIRRYLPSEF